MKFQAASFFFASVLAARCSELLAPPGVTWNGSDPILRFGRTSAGDFASAPHTHGPSRRNVTLPSMNNCRAVAEFVPFGAYAIDWRQLSTALTTAGSVKLYLPPFSQSAPEPITQLAISTTMFGCSAVIVARPN